MFDFDAGKLLIVGIIALIFIPPKDLPRVLRQVGQFVGKMRRMAAEFQGQFMDAIREADMADLRKEAAKLADAARVDTRFPSVRDLQSDVAGVLEAKSVASNPVEAKSVEAKSVESKSVEANPVEAESVEAKPDAHPSVPDDATAFEALKTEMRPLVEGDGQSEAPHSQSASTADRVPHSA